MRVKLKIFSFIGIIHYSFRSEWASVKMMNQTKRIYEKIRDSEDMHHFTNCWDFYNNVIISFVQRKNRLEKIGTFTQK